MMWCSFLVVRQNLIFKFQAWLQDVLRGMKYAAGAYGWNLLQGIMAKSAYTRITNIINNLPK